MEWQPKKWKTGKHATMQQITMGVLSLFDRGVKYRDGILTSKNNTVRYGIFTNETVQYLNGTVNDTLLPYEFC